MIKAMGLFLLILLKIAGWTLLILLIILLAALLLLLFIPVHYDVLAKNERSMEPGKNNLAANLRLQFKVSWLLHLVHVSVQYGPDGLSNHIRVAGIDIPKFLAKRAEKKEKHKKEKHKKEKHKKKHKKNDKSSKQESITEEFLLQESLAGESIPKESQMPGSQIKESQIKDSQIKDSQIKNSQIKDSQIKDSQIKDSQMSEFPTEEFLAEKEAFVPPEENIRENDSKIEKIKQQKSDNAKSEGKKPGQDHLNQNKWKQNQSEQRKPGNRKPGNQKPGNRKHEKIKQSKEKEEQNQKSKQSILSKIRSQFQRFHQEFTDEVNRHALSRLWTELLKLLKSYKPRKLKADISFSLADPALTGMATGAISLLPVIYRYPCSIAPDFTSEKLYVEGEILARGRVTVFVFLLSLLRLLRDKKFMYVVRRLLKRGGA